MITDPGTTTVRESRLQRDGLFGLLVLAFGVALVRGFLGASTEAGRAAVSVIFGALLVLLVLGWARVVRRPDSLEVSDATIRYVTGSGKQSPSIEAKNGTELRFVVRHAGRVTLLYLSQPQTGARVSLRLFARKPIKRACEAHGWRFR